MLPTQRGCWVAEFALTTERLVMRAWRDTDVAELLAICRDPRVMEFLGPLQCEADVRTAIDRQRGHQATLGHCYWALERRDDGALLGFCGIQPEITGIPVPESSPDIGWRLAYDAWGQGYAREAATAALGWGFDSLDTEAIWAITVPANTRSWGLMERLGMTRRHDLDFEHPGVPVDSPLKQHLVYQKLRT